MLAYIGQYFRQNARNLAKNLVPGAHNENLRIDKGVLYCINRCLIVKELILYKGKSYHEVWSLYQLVSLQAVKCVFLLFLLFIMSQAQHRFSFDLQIMVAQVVCIPREQKNLSLSFA